MNNTPFLTKCQIICEFTELYPNADWASDYFAFYNLGVPWALGVAYGDITAHDNAVKYIDAAFIGLLDLLGVDKYAEFDTLTQLMEVANESR